MKRPAVPQMEIPQVSTVRYLAGFEQIDFGVGPSVGGISRALVETAIKPALDPQDRPKLDKNTKEAEERTAKAQAKQECAYAQRRRSSGMRMGKLECPPGSTFPVDNSIEDASVAAESLDGHNLEGHLSDSTRAGFRCLTQMGARLQL